MSRRSLSLWREALLGLLWLLPLLIPYGVGLWTLHRAHLVLAWLGLMLAITLLLALLGRMLARKKDAAFAVPPDVCTSPVAEQRARAAIRRIQESLFEADGASPAAIEALLRRTWIAVAEAWHPDRRHPELRFTLPEALALSEELSRRLRLVLRDELPVLQHLEIAHAFRLREQVAPARKLWRLYRLGRFAFNPLSALLAEARGALMDGLTPMLLASARGKIAAVLVRETGEMAIKLYAGRFRQGGEADLPETVAEPGPLVFFVAGQGNAGKSSLVNALSGRERAVASPLPCPPGFQAFALEVETAGDLVLVDSGGLRAVPDSAWLDKAATSDLVLWVLAAHRADRAIDQAALAGLRQHFASRPETACPPVLLVLNQVDRLDPPTEWSPPYDPEEGRGRKEGNMRASLAAACERLGIDAAHAVTVMLENPAGAWNLEALWWAIHQALPAARQRQLERLARRRGLLDGVRDGVRSLPGVFRQGWRLLKRP